MSTLTSPFANLFGIAIGNIINEDKDGVIEDPLRVAEADPVGVIKTPRGDKNEGSDANVASDELEFSSSVVRSIEEVKKGKPQYSRQL